MDDAMTAKPGSVEMTLAGKTKTVTPNGPWFMTDGYSPVAMQEEMMRWWLAKGKPAAFTVYPSGATVHIEPAEALTVEGKAAHGYTVGGLIWGGESLWMDDDRNLVALVSTDAEFDHFEAVREADEAHLGEFIGGCREVESGGAGEVERLGEDGSGEEAGDCGARRWRIRRGRLRSRTASS